MNTSPYLTINGTALDIDGAQTLAMMLDGFDIRTSLQQHFAVLELAKSKGISASSSELQAAFNDFRHDEGLERAEDTDKWRTRNRISDEAVRLYCLVQVCRQKLLAAVAEKDIADVFADMVRDETLFYLFSLPFADVKTATSTAEAIRAGDMSFNDAVNQHGDRETKSVGGFLGEVPRTDLPKAFREAIISVDPGTTVGPLAEDGEWVVILVADRVEPELEDFADMIREELVNEELAYYIDRTVVTNREP